MTAQGLPTFTRVHRAELEACERLPEQIAELEANLQRIAAFKYRQVPKEKIRARIQTVSRPLAKALKALEKVRDDALGDYSLDRLLPNRSEETERSLASMDALAAWDRLEWGIHEQPPRLSERLQQLTEEVAKIECQLMATGQNRRKVSWIPIQIILDALLEGWLKHHIPGYPETNNRAKPLPPYIPMPVNYYQRDKQDDFSRVVRCCYLAAGIPSSPDKAVRAWLAWDEKQRQRRVESRKEANELLPESQRYRPEDLVVTPRRRFGRIVSTAAPKKTPPSRR